MFPQDGKADIHHILAARQEMMGSAEWLRYLVGEVEKKDKQLEYFTQRVSHYAIENERLEKASRRIVVEGENYGSIEYYSAEDYVDYLTDIARKALEGKA